MGLQYKNYARMIHTDLYWHPYITSVYFSTQNLFYFMMSGAFIFTY